MEKPFDSLPLLNSLPFFFLLGTDSTDISSITGINWGRAWLKQTKGYIDLKGLP